MSLPAERTSCDVLIVGAGPTGLLLGYWLARLGIKALIVDPKSGPTPETRAVATQARTLETYDMLGLGERALALGIKATGISMWSHQHEIGVARFAEMGEGVSPHPYVFMLGQDRTEQLLVEAIEETGGAVQWGVAFETLTQDDAGVTATLTRPDGTAQTVHARYVAGCDGAKSPVRHALGIPFSGGTYAERFFVADTTAVGPLREGEISLCIDEGRFNLFFPLKGDQHYRVVAMVKAELKERTDLTFEDLRADLEAHSGMKVTNVSWFSTYNVHHRVAERFQDKRVFLVGDAAHVHSPVGGQGMNTGLMDATNLAWKLAAVVTGSADARLLLSYEAERIPFARQLVATTDRAFTMVTSVNPVVSVLRALVVPGVFLVGTHIPLVRHELFGVVSQTRIRYDASLISRGQAGTVRGGDRLPWVPQPDGSSNFAALTGLTAHFQVYGEVPAPLAAFALAHPAWKVVQQPFTAATEAAGIRKDAVYFLRPDGYVAYAAERFEAAAFESYMRDGWGSGLPGEPGARATAGAT